MDRKTYMRHVYSKYWINARETVYKFGKYDRSLCDIIRKHAPIAGKLLEVACGYGYPVADYLQKAGYEVYGIDVSPELIEKCKQLNPGINCAVGDAEDISYPDNHFDCVYCFQSSWYFPDLNKAIDEMLRVTRPGGLVLFDIQNRNKDALDAGYRRRLFETSGMGRILLYIKNIAKIVLRRGVPIWHSVVFSAPTYPESVYRHLKEREVTSFRVMVEKADESIETINEPGPLSDFGRLIFFVRK